MSTIWNDLPKPFFVLAPMEAVTDVVFRHVVARAGRPDVFFTEFTNATGWFRAGDKAIGGRLIKTDDEGPIIAQLWGSDPEAMAALSQHCVVLGYDGIDINMGCPDQSAIKGGGGADMIRHPDRAAAIIAAAKTSGLPVSVKTRLGYTYLAEWRDWLTFVLQQDIPVLTIHLRTKKEMSKVPAHMELIPDIMALRDEIAPGTLIVINGDIRDRAHGLELAEQYGVDGVMIGRGIFQNPFAFDIVQGTGSTPTASFGEDSAFPAGARQEAPADNQLAPSGSETKDGGRGAETEAKKRRLLDLLLFHLDEYDRYAGQTGRPFETLKRFFKIYIRDFDGASSLRAALMLTTSTTAARQLLDNHRLSHTTLEPRLQTPYNTPMHTSVKAIVFDSDGTLVDTRQFVLNGYKTVLKNHGLEHLTSDSYIKQRLGKPIYETYEQILAGHDTHLSIDELVKEHDSVQDTITDQIRPYPYTKQLLEEWHAAGIKLCLFTSGSRYMIDRNFAAAGIKNPEQLFDAIITADDKIARKPEPDAINQLLIDVGVLPEDAVVVGDYAYDMIAAARARVGLKVGILHGFGTSKELLDAGADFLCDRLLSLNNLMNFADNPTEP